MKFKSYIRKEENKINKIGKVGRREFKLIAWEKCLGAFQN